MSFNDGVGGHVVDIFRKQWHRVQNIYIITEEFSGS